MKVIGTIDELFLEELSDVNNAEKQFLEAQKTMLEKATNPTLRTGIETHIAESEEQVGVLKQVFAALEAKPKRVKCDVAEGLVEEGDKMMKEAKGNPQILDVVIASAITKVEHYEIASYRGLVATAKEMERDDIVTLLLQNLEQEEETAAKVEQSLPALIRAAMDGQTDEEE